MACSTCNFFISDTTIGSEAPNFCKSSTTLAYWEENFELLINNDTFLYMYILYNINIRLGNWWYIVHIAFLVFLALKCFSGQPG